MNFKALEHPDKLRGGYYTPAPLAEFLVAWGMAGGARSVLEPSCGDGALLRPLLSAARLPERLDAVELLPSAADAAEPLLQALRARGVQATLHRMDTLSPGPGALQERYELVLGNPPYIRYQYIEEDLAAGARRVVEAAGLPFTRHTNAWMPFLLDGLGRLTLGGRLAMVIPAELLQVGYASSLRAHLAAQPLDLQVLGFRSLVFPGITQEVLLLLAQRREAGPARVSVQELDDLSALSALDPQTLGAPTQPARAGKWTAALVRAPQRRALDQLSAHPDLPRFEDLATVSVGVVTGANAFFCVDEQTLARYALQPIALPLLGRSQQASGLCFTKDDHEAGRAQGQLSWLLHFPATPEDQLPEPWRRYLRLGQDQGIPSRFKCRIREPWYTVPSVWASPLSLFKRCHHTPRLLLNAAQAVSTDTAYRVSARDPSQERALALGFGSSLAALSAELCGRSYGGGVLELVPSEIRALRLLPLPDRGGLFQRVDTLLRARCAPEDLHALLDPLVLGEGLGLDEAEIRGVQSAWAQLRDRRLARR